MLSECLQLLLCAAIGFAAAATKLITPNFRVALQTFVFHIALPLLVARGVALQVDFFKRDMWAFVGTFIALRVLTLGAASVVTGALRTRCYCDNFISFFRGHGHAEVEGSPHRSPGGGTYTVASQICEVWLGLSWISTVIIGVPVLTSALGDETFALKLGLQAAISSFIFQLPGILLLLEIHAADPATSSSTFSSSSSSSDASAGGYFRRVAARMAVNPVLLGILAGVILSVSGAGAWLKHDYGNRHQRHDSQYAAFIPVGVATSDVVGVGGGGSQH